MILMTAGRAGLAFGAAILSIGITIGLSKPTRVFAQDAQALTSIRFEEAMQRGGAALRAGRRQEALEAFREANAAAGKRSALALLGVARAFHELGAFKNELDACTEGLKYVGGDTALEGALHNQRGIALYSLSQTNRNPRQLPEAETELRLALSLPDAGPLFGGSRSHMVLVPYNLAVVLLKQNKDSEGLELMRTFVESGAVGREVEEGKRVLENPRCARILCAPDFTLTSLAGEYVSLKELRGSVVVLDFWGTWCPPCLVATPALVDLYKKHTKDNEARGVRFEMIGLSSDPRSAEGKVRAYIDSKKMLWPQYIDATRQIHQLFTIDGFPTYLVIDAEGGVRERISGWNSGTKDQLDSAIRRLLNEATAARSRERSN